MRRVKVYKAVPRERTLEELKEGGSRYYYEKVFDYVGAFMGYGLEVEECDSGIASYTVAIVERDDGFVELVNTGLIQFIDPRGGVSKLLENLTPEQRYLVNRGMLCPVCFSENIECVGEVYKDNHKNLVHDCADCGAKWEGGEDDAKKI